MSSSTIENVVSEIKEKKPTLSGKLQKFMVFGYSFVQQLKSANLLADDASVDAAFAQLQMFASVEDQTQFYERILGEASANGKLMRKFIQNKNKPPKAEKKPRAPRKKKEAMVADAAVEGVETVIEKKEPKVRKPRAKKSINVVNDTENNIIGQLVTAAQTDEDATATATATATAAKSRKKAELKVVNVDVNVETREKDAPTENEKKPCKKAAAVENEKNPRKKAEPREDDKKEKKPRKKAESKNVNMTTTEVELVKETIVEKEEDEEEEEEIHTREFILDGVKYLIDDENNVYSEDETHVYIGRYDSVSKTIVSM